MVLDETGIDKLGINSHMCCVSSLRLEWTSHLCPLSITKFLTRESNRHSKTIENGNEACRLFINLKFQKLNVHLCMLATLLLLPLRICLELVTL